MNEQILSLLRNWAVSSELFWSSIHGRPEYGVYGTGYDGWGVQTQQKYVAALALLAARGGELRGFDTAWALDRAMAALRFNLDSHKSGPWHCTDGAKWGHTWISALGVERIMFAVHLLRPHFTDRDHEALRIMLCSEADWLLTSYQRGSHSGITGAKWNSEGGNDPESNIWNGALLWRTAEMYPDHPCADAWRERAHCFFINGVSMESDADCERIVAGKPVRERFIGPNFFPNYALDHHGYLNVGYMVICVSNAAMLHFDMKAAGLARPESLDHHLADLWAVLRRFIFADGRLARIGGDTRVRYAYCQEYLLPALLYAEDRLGEAHTRPLIAGRLEAIKTEARFSGDGSFYSRRLEALARQSTLYYTRLESDRACALAMLAAYEPLAGEVQKIPAGQTFEQSVAGSWCEPEHGAAVHRSPTRFVSFAWRAFDLAQGLCLPPDDGNLAEWERNLGGGVDFSHHPHPSHGADKKRHRRIGGHHVETFEGGFATCGWVIEGVDLVLAESWCGTDSAVHQIVFAALPDGHTVIGLNHCRMGNRRGYVSAIKGLNYVLPNDLYNGCRRRLFSAKGEIILDGPPERELLLPLDSLWANIEQRIGLTGLYGAGTLAVHRSPKRRAGVMKSLYTEEIGFPVVLGPSKFEAGEMILDVGWAALASVGAAHTRAFAESNRQAKIDTGLPDVRAVRVAAYDGKIYAVAANFGMAPAVLAAGMLFPEGKTLRCLQSEIPTAAVTLPPCQAGVFICLDKGGINSP